MKKQSLNYQIFMFSDALNGLELEICVANSSLRVSLHPNIKSFRLYILFEHLNVLHGIQFSNYTLPNYIFILTMFSECSLCFHFIILQC